MKPPRAKDLQNTWRLRCQTEAAGELERMAQAEHKNVGSCSVIKATLLATGKRIDSTVIISSKQLTRKERARYAT